MANIKSAIKNIRATKRRTRQNKIWRDNIKKALKALRLNKDGSKIEGLLRKVQSVAAKAAKKRVIHKNKAGRLVSKVFSKR